MNGQVEVTWRTLRTIVHALVVHARVPEVYVHFALMYSTDHIFPVLPIKYLKIPKLYGMENITTAEVLDKLDMFQSRFWKIDQFGWWDLERISADAGTLFTLTEFKE